jgi:hypothetical protein
METQQIKMRELNASSRHIENSKASSLIAVFAEMAGIMTDLTRRFPLLVGGIPL